MIHGPGHSSDEFKVLGEFGNKYVTSHITMDQGRNPIPRRGFQKKQENHTIIDKVVDELHMIESKKVSFVNHETPEFWKVTTMITTCIR